jgi:ABC-type sugar transport system permease subunit
VTMPGLRGTTFLVSILIAVSAMRVFTELYILGGNTGGIGGQDVSLVFLIEQYGSGFDGQLGYASALSVLLFALTLIPLIVYAQLNRRNEA